MFTVRCFKNDNTMHVYSTTTYSVSHETSKDGNTGEKTPLSILTDDQGVEHFISKHNAHYDRVYVENLSGKTIDHIKG